MSTATSTATSTVTPQPLQTCYASLRANGTQRLYVGKVINGECRR